VTSQLRDNNLTTKVSLLKEKSEKADSGIFFVKVGLSLSHDKRMV
jgi:hypothetical protein